MLQAGLVIWKELSLEMRALASNLQSFSDCYSYTALETIFNLSRFPSGYASNVSLCQYHRYTHNNMFLCIYLPPTFATPFLSNFTKDDFLMILTKTLFNICLEDINTRTFEWSVCSRDVVKQNNINIGHSGRRRGAASFVGTHMIHSEGY